LLVLTVASYHQPASRHLNIVYRTPVLPSPKLLRCNKHSQPRLGGSRQVGITHLIRFESSSFGPWLETVAVLSIELFVGRSGVVRRSDFLAIPSREASKSIGWLCLYEVCIPHTTEIAAPRDPGTPLKLLCGSCAR
jgi:hypothetical protein